MRYVSRRERRDMVASECVRECARRGEAAKKKTARRNRHFKFQRSALAVGEPWFPASMNHEPWFGPEPYGSVVQWFGWFRTLPPSHRIPRAT